MTKLVLLVSPNEMLTHKNEKVLRKLFEEHKYDSIEVVSNFLDDNGVVYSTQIGKNEFGDTLVAYSVDGKNLFGVKH